MTYEDTGNMYLDSGDRLNSALYPSLYHNMLGQDLVPPTERHIVFFTVESNKSQVFFYSINRSVTF
jgi:hypothetical protein